MLPTDGRLAKMKSLDGRSLKVRSKTRAAMYNSYYSLN